MARTWASAVMAVVSQAGEPSRSMAADSSTVASAVVPSGAVVVVVLLVARLSGSRDFSKHRRAADAMCSSCAVCSTFTDSTRSESRFSSRRLTRSRMRETVPGSTFSSRAIS